MWDYQYDLKGKLGKHFPLLNWIFVNSCLLNHKLPFASNKKSKFACCVLPFKHVVSSYYEGEYFWDYHVNARHCHALVFLEVSPLSALSNCLFMKKKQIKLGTTKFRKLDEFP